MPWKQYLQQDEDDTESTCSESVYTLDSSLHSYSRFEPSDAFSPRENAILLKLSKQLGAFQQDDVLSIVEESTIASSKLPTESSAGNKIQTEQAGEEKVISGKGEIQFGAPVLQEEPEQQPKQR